MRCHALPWVCGLVVLLSSGIARAQYDEVTNYPSQARGLSEETAYQVGDVDSINLHNGNLVLRVPLGLTYPVGPALSYGFTLYYNSNGWDYEERTCYQPNQPIVHYTLPVPDVDDRTYVSTGNYPEKWLRRNNAGFGWALQLGRLAPDRLIANDWDYSAPDGSVHTFGARLHPEGQSSTDADVSYSNDGTYLRLQEYGPGPALPPECTPAPGATNTKKCVHVEFPDGEVHEFHDYGSEGAPDWRLTRRYDPFGNWIAVRYGPDDPDNTEDLGLVWIVTDSQGRRHTIRFHGPAYSYSRVDRVELEAPGGTTATYELMHQAAILERPGFLGVPGTEDPGPGVTPPCSQSAGDGADAQVLTRIVLPDGSFYDFDYYEQDSDYLPGGVRRMRLPTGGELRWTYTTKLLRYGAPDPNGEEPVETIHPVERRERVDAVNPDPGDPTAYPAWTYAWAVSSDHDPNDESRPCHLEVKVTDPEGNESLNYFARHTSSAGWAEGLPFTVCGTEFRGAFLSSRQWDAAGTLLRSTYVVYASDSEHDPDQTPDFRNTHMTREVTVFEDDPAPGGEPRYRETEYDDFDGFGYWGAVTTSSNFTSGELARTVATTYNTPGGYALGPDGGPVGDYAVPPKEAPWLLGLATSREIRQGQTYRSERCYDPDTGFLRAERRIASPSATPSTDDLLTVYETPAEGEALHGWVTEASWYGGDGGDAGTGEICASADSPPGTPAYRMGWTYRYGVAESATALDPAQGGPVLRHYLNEIDPGSGLLLATTDSSGVKTTFSYDALGRRTSAATAEGARVERSYELPGETGGGGAQITITTCPHAAPGCDATTRLDYRDLRYDGLGRLKRQRVERPLAGGVQRTKSDREYDGLDRLVRTSMPEEQAYGGALHWAERRDLDPFGRPGEAESPDGSEVVYAYLGERQRLTETQVATGANGSESPSYRLETWDGHGRLVEVCDGASSPSTCDGTLATYTYDAADRLTDVCLRPGGVSACRQERHFTYDGRGFLTAENHPELDNAFQRHRYDARGHLTQTRIQGTGSFTRYFTYDAAGRLVREEEQVGSSRRPLAEYFYHPQLLGGGGAVLPPPAAESGEKAAGRLFQRRRHNWVGVPLQDFGPPYKRSQESDIAVTDTFRYGGLDGAVSYRHTRVGLDDFRLLGLETSYLYDEMGRVTELTYPRCDAEYAGACPSRGPERRMVSTYDGGALVGVAAESPGSTPATQVLAAGIAYHPDGLLDRIVNGNGITYERKRDGDHMPRPARILASRGSSTLWDSGSYAYDGSGNVRAIGADRYAYDRLGRLVSGKVVGEEGARTQQVSYDAYGNVTHLETPGPAASPAYGDHTFSVDEGTNRLQGSAYGYDEAGNLTELTSGDITYQMRWTSDGRLKELDHGPRRLFLYDAAGERVALVECTVDEEGEDVCGPGQRLVTATFRDEGQRLLRSYFWDTAGDPAWSRDYFHDGDGLLATVAADGWSYLHADHLGSPRLITDAGGQVASRHRYFPYGQEYPEPVEDGVVLKFTGHERDPGFIDFMHARYYTGIAGRFLSVDPAVGVAERPSSWNRYGYVEGSPLLLVDPDGRAGGLKCDPECVGGTNNPAEALRRLEQLNEKRLPVQVAFDHASARALMQVGAASVGIFAGTVNAGAGLAGGTAALSETVTTVRQAIKAGDSTELVVAKGLDRLTFGLALTTIGSIPTGDLKDGISATEALKAAIGIVVVSAAADQLPTFLGEFFTGFQDAATFAETARQQREDQCIGGTWPSCGQKVLDVLTTASGETNE